MAEKSAKQEEAVRKIGKAVRKAVEKGVSLAVVEETVKSVIADGAAAEKAEPAATKKAKVIKIPGTHTVGDITLTRGVVNAAEAPRLKKLPGKRKPPTLTLKRSKASDSGS